MSRNKEGKAALSQLNIRVPIIVPTGDTLNRTAEILSKLTSYNALRIKPGNIYVSAIVALAVGQKICGEGELSKLLAKSTLGTNPLITCGGQNIIEDMTVYGQGASAKPASVDADKHGIKAIDNASYIRIARCAIRNLDGKGVYVSNVGYSGLESLHIQDCSFYYVGCGVHFADYGEYATIMGSSFRYNHIGCLNEGGNNQFSTCHFGANTDGFHVVGTDMNNPGHGSAVGCSFNHNTNYGIYIKDNPSGFTFTGCQIHLNAVADVVIENSSGISFNGGCQFGTNAKIIITGGGLVQFDGCKFNGAPVFTITDNATVILNNCYQLDGTPVTLS